MFLDGQLPKSIQVPAIPSKVRMRISQSTHQRPTPAHKVSHFGILLQLLHVRDGADVRDALAFDVDVAAVGGAAGGVEDLNVGEEEPRGGVRPKHFVFFGLEGGVEFYGVDGGDVAWWAGVARGVGGGCGPAGGTIFDYSCWSHGGMKIGRKSRAGWRSFFDTDLSY